MASVSKHPKSPFWQANFKTWSRDREQFVRVAQSTGIPSGEPRIKAQRIADELEGVGRALAPDCPNRPGRDFYIATLERLYSLAGLNAPRVSASWKIYSDEWLEDKRVGVDAKTISTYASAINKLTEWLKGRADQPLDSIDRKVAQSYVNHLEANGYSPGTISNGIARIRSVMRCAVQDGLTSINPFERVQKPVNESVLRRQPFTREEVELMLEKTEELGLYEWHLAILLGYHLGLRINDAVSLKREHFSRDLKTLSFRPSKKRKTITLPTSSRIRRAIKDFCGPGQLTPGLAGTADNKISTDFIEVAESVGVKIPLAQTQRGPCHRKSFHSLRHTNKSLMVNAGVDSRIADRLNGHDDPSIADGYTHLDVETMATALKQAGLE